MKISLICVFIMYCFFKLLVRKLIGYFNPFLSYYQFWFIVSPKNRYSSFRYQWFFFLILSTLLKIMFFLIILDNFVFAFNLREREHSHLLVDFPNTHHGQNQTRARAAASCWGLSCLSHYHCPHCCASRTQEPQLGIYPGTPVWDAVIDFNLCKQPSVLIVYLIEKLLTDTLSFIMIFLCLFLIYQISIYTILDSSSLLSSAFVSQVYLKGN